MSTRSYVSAKCSDGKIRRIFVKSDGDFLLDKLIGHYNSQALADSLMEYGTVDSLGETLGEIPVGTAYLDMFRGGRYTHPNGDDIDKAREEAREAGFFTEGCAERYRRNVRQKAKVMKTEKAACRDAWFISYVYYWDGRSWKRTFGNTDWANRFVDGARHPKH